MIRLGVNIDHIATLRQARYRRPEHGTPEPDPIQAAQTCQNAGCHTITAHLREDRRHIQDHDIRRLKQTLTIPLNLEMANTPQMINIALQTRPATICLVPENRAELTTEGGLNLIPQQKTITQTIQTLQQHNIQVSLFIDPDPQQIQTAHQTGATTIELHTGPFAQTQPNTPSHKQQLQRLTQAAQQAHQLHLQTNAGHGINYHNIQHIAAIPHLTELNIGHSIISRATQTGLTQAVKQMLTHLQHPPNQP